MFQLKICIALLLGTILFSLLAYEDISIYVSTKDAPNTISLSELVVNGYGDNAHIILTDFVLSDRVGIAGGDKKNAYIPATTVLDAVNAVMKHTTPNSKTGELELDEDYTYIPQHFPLIVCIYDTTDEKIESLSQADKIQGVVLTGFRSILGSGVRAQLIKEYPRADFNKMLALHVNKERPALAFMIGFSLAAFTCFLIFLFLVIRIIRNQKKPVPACNDGFTNAPTSY